MLAEKEEVCWDLAGLLAREGSLVVRPMVLGESALMPMACSLAKPDHLRECLLVRLRGSRESWTPPAPLRLVRKELLVPVGAKDRVSL